ncbi:hypothetical protein VFES401_13875 [Aliivibrio fischeri]|uniref:hypothetical protein n=1 Tax=Aliivibrio fischeri TaxID=668 RepID=UPI00107ECCFB|nr:hypothetical protein [Aliivibrio fischeri]TGA67997.1 hypothetical protein VFES401_13875 [Aliivibrio fischeri]
MLLIQTETQELKDDLAILNISLNHIGMNKYRLLKKNFPELGHDDILSVLDDWSENDGLLKSKIIMKIIYERHLKE